MKVSCDVQPTKDASKCKEGAIGVDLLPLIGVQDLNPIEMQASF
jgi:hypothetical protein